MYVDVYMYTEITQLYTEIRGHSEQFWVFVALQRISMLFYVDLFSVDFPLLDMRYVFPTP